MKNRKNMAKGRIIFGASGEELDIVSSGTIDEFFESQKKSPKKEGYKPFKVKLENGKEVELHVTDSGNIGDDGIKFTFQADDFTEMKLEKELEKKKEDKKEGKNIPPAHAPGGRCHGWISFE